jgi:hypothetical protein
MESSPGTPSAILTERTTRLHLHLSMMTCPTDFRKVVLLPTPWHGYPDSTWQIPNFKILFSPIITPAISPFKATFRQPLRPSMDRDLLLMEVVPRMGPPWFLAPI